MNAEYLLDAIGRLDDDLVQEAEQYRRRAHYGRWMGLAASLAVVILAGYVLTHVGGMSGGNGAAPSLAGGGNGGAPASGNSAPKGGDGVSGTADQEAPEAAPSCSEDRPDSPKEALDQDFAATNQETLSDTIFVDGGAYILSGEVLTELPGDAVLLGELLAPEPDAPQLNTSAEEYVGCPVWLLTEDPGSSVLYVELPGGGYLEFR